MREAQGDTGSFGPAVLGGGSPETPPRRVRRRLWLPVAFFVVVSLTAVGTVAAASYLGGAPVEQFDVEGLAVEAPTIQAPGEPALQEVAGVTNFLVVGSDSRTGLTDDTLESLGTDDEGTNLTDTLMVVQLDAEEGTASLLSFPRDLLVTRCDGSEGRINDAFGVGEETGGSDGPSCLVRTITRLTGITIHHFVQVDFEGFIGAVDAVGGVTFRIDEPLRDRYAGLDIPAGCVTFDGAKALGFVRARHIDNDFGRIARQQRFLRELLAKAVSTETLTDPSRVLGLVRVLQESIRTDDSLTTLEMARFAYTFRGLDSDDLRSFSVTGFDDEWNGASVIVIDEEQADPLFAAFRRGTIDQPADTVTAPGAVGSGGAEAPASAPATGSGAGAPTSPDDGGSPIAVPTAPAVPTPDPSPTFAGASTSDVAC